MKSDGQGESPYNRASRRRIRRDPELALLLNMVIAECGPSEISRWDDRPEHLLFLAEQAETLAGGAYLQGHGLLHRRLLELGAALRRSADDEPSAYAAHLYGPNPRPDVLRAMGAVITLVRQMSWTNELPAAATERAFLELRTLLLLLAVLLDVPTERARCYVAPVHEPPGSLVVASPAAPHGPPAPWVGVAA